MKHHIYFLKSIIGPNFWDELTNTESADVRRYLEDMQTGPADGEMDINWQEGARGYYKHPAILHRLAETNPQAVNEYLALLETDIKAWLTLSPDNYPVKHVKEMDFSKLTQQ